MFEAGAYDVAVVGAGPAGAATARRLAQNGCRVLLIERSAFDEIRVGETLAPSIQPLLTELGVWDRFIALDPLPSWGTRSVWGGPDPQKHSHMVSPYGCGWHVDRQRFDRMLADAAVSAGATLRTGTRLVECKRKHDERWKLTLRSGEQECIATASVVVDATGRNARLGQRLGARRVVLDKLIALTIQFAPALSDEQCYTLVETTEEGWWYSAPLAGDRLMVMLMTDSDLCHSAKLTLIGNLLVRLQDTDVTAVRVSNSRPVWGPHIFSAISQRLHREDTASHWLAVGDAALSVDPASGSGVIRALRTAAAGAVAALDLLQSVQPNAVEKYEADRDRECTLYLKEHARYYGMEHRWSESPFWRRRVGHRVATTD
nr:FAD-dependent oxidoreductase [Nitrosomonas nitrosa]